FFKNMLEGAKAHEAKRGDYTLKAVGMQSETDVETQINAIESFITQKVDAIVVAPSDSRALVPPIKRAVDAGITVVNFDVALD
ncbi:substrate-binding domain-containing protein, partial [Streptococcus suis]